LSNGNLEFFPVNIINLPVNPMNPGNFGKLKNFSAQSVTNKKVPESSDTF